MKLIKPEFYIVKSLLVDYLIEIPFQFEYLFAMYYTYDMNMLYISTLERKMERSKIQIDANNLKSKA